MSRVTQEETVAGAAMTAQAKLATIRNRKSSNDTQGRGNPSAAVGTTKRELEEPRQAIDSTTGQQTHDSERRATHAEAVVKQLRKERNRLRTELADTERKLVVAKQRVIQLEQENKYLRLAVNEDEEISYRNTPATSSDQLWGSSGNTFEVSSYVHALHTSAMFDIKRGAFEAGLKHFKQASEILCKAFEPVSQSTSKDENEHIATEPSEEDVDLDSTLTTEDFCFEDFKKTVSKRCSALLNTTSGIFEISSQVYTWHKLAKSYFEQDKYGIALELFKQTVHILKTTSERGSKSVAQAEKEIKKFERMAPENDSSLMDSTLTSSSLGSEQSSNETDPTTSSSMTDDFKMELQRLKQSTDILKKTSESNSVSIALMLCSTANTEAFVRCKYNQHGDAIILLKEILSVQNILGENHPVFATILNNISTLYKSLKKYNEAKVFCKKSLVVLEAVLGKSHFHVADQFNILAGLYWDQNRYDKAEHFYREALQAFCESCSSNHSSVLRTRMKLTDCCTKQEKYTEAEEQIKQILTDTVNDGNLSVWQIAEQLKMGNRQMLGSSQCYTFGVHIGTNPDIVLKAFDHLASTYRKSDKCELASIMDNCALQIGLKLADNQSGRLDIEIAM